MYIIFIVVLVLILIYALKQIQHTPRILHQTWMDWKSLPPNMKHNISKNLDILGPSVQYKFYNDDDCRNYIKMHCNPDVLKAYDMLDPVYSGAMRADLWRYCVMYHDGGLYLDIKSVIKTNPFNIFKNNRPTFFGCTNKHCLGFWRTRLPWDHYEQWALMSPPGNPIFKAIIDKCTSNILNKWSPGPDEIAECARPVDNTPPRKIAVLWITGPDMMSQVIHNSDNKFNKASIEKYFDYTFPEYNPASLYSSIKNHYANNNKPLYI